MPTILVVDDDRNLVATLELALSRYTVVNASDGEAALHQIAQEKPDLVLMDLMLAGMDGAALLPRIREVSTVPIIVLSGRAAQSDVVPALRQGADDFVEKPFELDDLEARIEAVLRRAKRVPVPTVPWQTGPLSVSDAHGTVINGVTLHVTPTEQHLLALLVEHTGETLSQKYLAQRLWGFDDARTSHMVDVHVMRLRERLSRVPNAPTIVNVRGAGFKIVERTAE